MANIDEYISGKIIRDADLALKSLKLLKIPLLGPYISRKLLSRVYWNMEKHGLRCLQKEN